MTHHTPAPGTEKPRRFIPKLRYELISCGLHGHEILGMDAAALRPADEIFAREAGGLRWYRCMRCDSWLALPPPENPARLPPCLVVRHISPGCFAAPPLNRRGLLFCRKPREP